MRRAAGYLIVFVIIVLASASPFACVYGCRAAWTAGGRV